MIEEKTKAAIVDALNGEFRDPSNNPFTGLHQVTSMDELPPDAQYHRNVGIIVVRDDKIDYLSHVIARRGQDLFECEGTIRKSPLGDDVGFGDSAHVGSLMDPKSAWGYEISGSDVQDGRVYLLTLREPEKQLGLFVEGDSEREQTTN